MVRNDQLELDYIEQTTRNIPADAVLSVNIDSRPDFKVALDEYYREINFFPVAIAERGEHSELAYHRYSSEKLWEEEKPLSDQEIQKTLYQYDRKMYPHFVRDHVGNVGHFSFLDLGVYPVYEFMNGERRVDNWELEHGANDIKELKENFMSMQGLKSRMESFIAEIMKKTHPELAVTQRISAGLLSVMDRALTNGEISMNSLYEDAEKFLKSEDVVKFVQDRQPEISPVPAKVVEHIREYFQSEMPGFTPVLVQRQSNAPGDNYLYEVVGRGGSGKYACWTSWNDSLQSLNHGHYNIKEDDAMQILWENFYDVTDEVEIYGPENSRIYFESDIKLTKLADDLNEFVKDFDFYDYEDRVEDVQGQQSLIFDDLRKGDTAYIEEYLSAIIEEKRGTEEEQSKAMELLGRVKEMDPVKATNELHPGEICRVYGETVILIESNYPTVDYAFVLTKDGVIEVDGKDIQRTGVILPNEEFEKISRLADAIELYDAAEQKLDDLRADMPLIGQESKEMGYTAEETQAFMNPELKQTQENVEKKRSEVEKLGRELGFPEDQSINISLEKYINQYEQAGKSIDRNVNEQVASMGKGR